MGRADFQDSARGLGGLGHGVVARVKVLPVAALMHSVRSVSFPSSCLLIISTETLGYLEPGRQDLLGGGQTAVLVQKGLLLVRQGSLQKKIFESGV